MVFDNLFAVKWRLRGRPARPSAYMRGREAFRDAKSTHRPGPVPLPRARSVRAEASFIESTKHFSADCRKSNEGYVGASLPLLRMRPASHEHFEGPRRGAAPAPMFTTARAAACAHSHAARTLTDHRLCAFPYHACRYRRGGLTWCSMRALCMS